MIALAAEDVADLRRWMISGAIVVLAYGGVAAAVIGWRDPIEPAELAGAIVIEFAPVLAAPAVQKTDLPPGPEMVMSDASPSRPVESLEEKPDEVTEPKIEAKLEKKVEETVESKPVEEPPPEVAPAPEPDVAVVPPPPEEVKKETPRREEPRPPAPTTSAPQVVPDEVAPMAEAPTPTPTPRNSAGVVKWMAQISAALERNKRYPPKSEARREQGTAQVRFTLDRQGRVIESRLVRSSGAAALDEEAMALLQRAQPFAPWPPKEFASDRVDLTVPIRFNLK